MPSDYNRASAISREILARYDRYTGHLKFPGDWGERPIRGWLVSEVFHDVLGWPFGSIILGERFDTLFVDDMINPKVYLETKIPRLFRNERNLGPIEKKAINLAKRYPTIEQVVISDVESWFRIDLVRHLRALADVKSGEAKWKTLVRGLRFEDYS